MVLHAVSDLKVKFGIEAIAFSGDLSSIEVQDELIALGKEKQITVLINNAGFAIHKTFYEGNLDQWLKMSQLHMTCVLRVTHSLLQHMVSKNEGTVINVASDAAYLIAGKNAVYSGTKAFMRQFSHGLYIDLLDKNIYVQALCPGLTKTDLHKKMGMKKEQQKNREIIQWEEPKNVVSKSIQAMKRKKAICICSFSTKFLICIASILPKKMYYYVVQLFLNKKIDMVHN